MKRISAVLILCMLINCFVPKFTFGAEEFNFINKVIESQTILLQYCSLSTIPLKIISSMILNNSAQQEKSSMGKKALPAGDNGCPVSAASITDSAHMNPGLKFVSFETDRQFTSTNSGGEKSAGIMCGAVFFDKLYAHKMLYEFMYLYLFLLISLLLLPRGAIDDNVLIIKFNTYNPTHV